jgi:hypothetical protein
MRATADKARQETAKPRHRRRRFEAGIPANALTWKGRAEKAKRMNEWRDAVGKVFPESGRILRVAWALEWLFGVDGFAYPTDGFLSAKLGIPVNKIQKTLTDLESEGAIIRASVFVQGRAQRRIWPCVDIVKRMPPTMGGVDTPHKGARGTPYDGGTEYLRKGTGGQARQFTRTLQAARQAADIRARCQARRGNAAPDSDTAAMMRGTTDQDVVSCANRKSANESEANVGER